MLFFSSPPLAQNLEQRLGVPPVQFEIARLIDAGKIDAPGGGEGLGRLLFVGGLGGFADEPAGQGMVDVAARHSRRSLEPDQQVGLAGAGVPDQAERSAAASAGVQGFDALLTPGGRCGLRRLARRGPNQIWADDLAWIWAAPWEAALHVRRSTAAGPPTRDPRVHAELVQPGVWNEQHPARGSALTNMPNPPFVRVRRRLLSGVVVLPLRRVHRRWWAVGEGGVDIDVLAFRAWGDGFVRGPEECLEGAGRGLHQCFTLG